MRHFLLLVLLISGVGCNLSNRKQDSRKTSPVPAERWDAARANQWYARQGGWLAGSNYTPAYAVNQLEFWQPESFDTSRIDKELGWAQDLGFNVMRVFLHDLLWKTDSTGFVDRMNQFLTISHRRHIGVMFVLFDGVWNPFPESGKQPAPTPFVHNSQWVQSPGAELLSDTARYGQLEDYVKGVISHFGDDSRVILWDLFNEPDNDNGGRFPKGLSPEEKYKYAFILLKKSFQWAREVNPSQPLTVAPWHRDWKDTAKMDPMDKFMFDHSDVISFHDYEPLAVTKEKVELLKRYGRPVICSEYMARPTGSTFQNILPYFKEEQVGAINWGFVNGKTQTIYPWDSWTKKYTAPPGIWFHDIFHEDGTPYDTVETNLIKSLTASLK